MFLVKLNLNYAVVKQLAKVVGFIKTCDQCPEKFNFDHFFNPSITTVPEGLYLKFRSKFNHHGCLRFAILKT